MTTRSLISNTGRLPGLDILRGLAILLVLLRHGFPSRAGSAGIVGVVVFFTLSGYLITGVLLRDLDRTGRIQYGHFYRNRALRLLPALLVVVAAFAIVEFSTDTLGDRDRILKTVLVAITYTADVPVLNDISLGLSHLWTLAVEKQFYLVWPLLLTFAIRRRRVKTVLLLAAVAAAIVCALSIVIAAPEKSRVYRLPTSWVLALLVGAGGQLGRQRVHESLGALPLSARASVPVALLLLASALPDANDSPLLYLVAAPVVALLTVVLIDALSELKRLPVALVPLHRLGIISPTVPTSGTTSYACGCVWTATEGGSASCP